MAERIGLEAFVDTSKFGPGFATYVSGMDKMIFSTDRLSATMDETAKPSVNLANKITDLGNRVLLQQRQSALYQQELAKLSAQFGSTSAQALKKQLQIDRLSVSIDKNTRTLGTYRQQVEASQKNLQHFEQEAKETEKSLSRLDVAVGAFAGVTLAGVFKSAVSTGVSLFVDLWKEAYNAVAAHEKLTLAIETLTARELLNTGQAENMAEALGMADNKAQGLIKWIEELAVKSPFTSEDIAATFKLAQAYGFTSDEAQRLTQVLTDFTAGTGQSGQVGERLALALGQIQAKGKVSAQELNQLRETGLNVNEVLEGMGFGLNDVEKGLVKADAFISQVVQTLERDFQGAAERQTESWAGLLSTLEDTKKIALREFFQGTFDAIQPLVADFVATLSSEEFKTSLREAGQAMGDLVAAGIKLAKETDWQLIADATSQMAQDASKLEPIFNPKEALEAAAKSYLIASASLHGIIEAAKEGEIVELFLGNSATYARELRGELFDINKEFDRLVKLGEDAQRARGGIAKEGGGAPTGETFGVDTSLSATDLGKLGEMTQEYGASVDAVFEKISKASADYVSKERELQGDLAEAWQDQNSARQEAAIELSSGLIEAENEYKEAVIEIGQERLELDEELNASRLRADQEFNQERAKLEKDFNQETIEIGKQRLEAEASLNEGRQEAEKESLAALSELEREHTEEVVDINRDLGRTIEDYNRERLQAEEEFSRERATLESEHAQKVKDASQAILDAESDTADKRLSIQEDLKDRLDDLEDKRKDKIGSIQEHIAEILEKSPLRGLGSERGLSKEDQKRLADLRKALASETQEFDDQRTDLEQKAQDALDKEIERSNEHLANLQDKLDQENQAYTAAIEEQDRKFAQQEEDRKRGYDRAVEDLTLRLQRENEEFDRQRGDIQSKLNDRLSDLQASYDAAIVKLDERLATERTKLDEQRAALQGKYQDELIDIQQKHDEAIGKLEARFAKETAEYAEQRANLQAAYREEVADIEASYADRVATIRQKLQDIAVANAEKQLELREQMRETKDDFEEKIGQISAAWIDKTATAAAYVEAVLGRLQQVAMATNIPLNITATIPEVITPGSPSPLELSLMRTAGLIQTLNSTTLSIPTLSTPMVNSPAMVPPMVRGGDTNLANSFGDIVLQGSVGSPQEARNVARQGGAAVESELAALLMDGARRQRGNFRPDFGVRT